MGSYVYLAACDCIQKRILVAERRHIRFFFTDKEGNMQIYENGVADSRNRSGKPYWVFPGGGGLSDEQPEKGAKREFKEETGVDLDGIINITTNISFKYDRTDRVDVCFAEVNDIYGLLSRVNGNITPTDYRKRIERGVADDELKEALLLNYTQTLDYFYKNKRLCDWFLYATICFLQKKGEIKDSQTYFKDYNLQSWHYKSDEERNRSF